MRLLTIILLLLPMIANAQSQIPRALSEPLNLAPRCQRGDAQKLLLEVDYLFLDETGMITSIKKSSLQYTVLCLENTVGEKVVWEAAIDSFKIGSKAAPGSRATRHSVLTEFEGYSFDIAVAKKVPVRDGCYDFGIPIEENLHYIEGFEFLTMIIPLKIIEQLRFTAGRRLGLIGDTLTLALPQPVCFQIPNVIDRYHVKQEPFHLEVTGLTKVNGKPCAVVKIESKPSPLEIRFHNALVGSGSSWLTGEFMVSLRNGQIIAANLRDRMDATRTLPDGTVASNKVLLIIKLTPRN